jgi:hypothetical protein
MGMQRLCFGSAVLLPAYKRLETGATPIATTPIQDLPSLSRAFFCRPAGVVAHKLIGCLLVKRQAGGQLLRAVIVETEAYCQSEPVFKNSTNFQGPLAAIAGPAYPRAGVPVWLLFEVGCRLV